MSCAAFTGLGVYVAAWHKDETWIVGGSAALAAIFFIIAAYKAWRLEHELYIGEVAKNEKPEIQGEVYGFSPALYRSDGVFDRIWHVQFEFNFTLFMCNHKPISTTIRQLRLDGSLLCPKVIFEVTLAPDISLSHGIGKTFPITLAKASIDGLGDPNVGPINLDRLQVTVTDSFEQTHLIRVRAGASLTPPGADVHRSA